MVSTHGSTSSAVGRIQLTGGEAFRQWHAHDAAAVSECLRQGTTVRGDDRNAVDYRANRDQPLCFPPERGNPLPVDRIG